MEITDELLSKMRFIAKQHPGMLSMGAYYNHQEQRQVATILDGWDYQLFRGDPETVEKVWAAFIAYMPTTRVETDWSTGHRHAWYDLGRASGAFTVAK